MGFGYARLQEVGRIQRVTETAARQPIKLAKVVGEKVEGVGATLLKEGPAAAIRAAAPGYIFDAK